MTTGRISRETIKTIITNLGQDDFDELVQAIISGVLDVQTLNVDGAGDSGSDLIELSRTIHGTAIRSVAAQMTVQKAGWKQKLLADAEKASKLPGVNQFYFATCNDIGRKAIEQAENEVGSSLGISCKILGARELAELALDLELDEQVVASLGINFQVTRRLTGRERILHMLATCSDEANEVRRSVIEDMALCILLQDGDQTRQALMDSIAMALGTPDTRLPAIESSIDSLLTRQIIHAPQPRLLGLTQETRSRLKSASRLFDFDFSRLLDSISKALDGKAISRKDKNSIAVLGCHCHCASVIAAVRVGDQPPAHPRLLRLPKSPQSRLENILTKYYPNYAARQSAIKKVIDASAKSSIVHRLARGYLFAFLEHGNALRAISVLGASNWSDVSAFLDTSTAIPLLCSRLFGPVRGPFPEGSMACVDALQSLGAVCFLPPAYLEECATHLIQALDYTPLESQVEALIHSQNGFVSHFARLKSEGQPAPQSLADFITSISRSAGNRSLAWSRRRQACTSDIARLAQKFQISTPTLQQVRAPKKRSTHWHKLLTRKLAFQGKERAPILVRHDSEVLAQAEYHAMGGGGPEEVPTLLVSWDRALVECVLSEIEGQIRAFSPAHLSDLVSSLENVDSPQLVAVGIELARHDQSGARKVADLLDTVVRDLGSDMREWQLQSSESKLREVLRRRVEGSLGSLAEWIDRDLKPLFGTSPE